MTDEYRHREGSHSLKWKAEGSGKMRYEESHPWHWPQPDSSEFRSGWDAMTFKCVSCGRQCWGQDSLAQHVAEAHPEPAE